MRRLRKMAVVVAVVLVAPIVQASAAAPTNAVIAWDLKAETAIYDIAQQAPPQVAGRSFAMVSGAVYDAVNAIAGKPYQPYLKAPRANGTESTDAAVATAATGVLTALFPDQRDRLRADYTESLAAIPDGHAKQGGIRIGNQTAAAMIASRENDGSDGTELWPVGDEPGQWRPTPPDFANGVAWVAHLKPFAVPDIAKFTTPGPPALTSREYARDVNEVKLLGSAMSTVRTADQTEAARWWHDRRSVSWEIKRNLATTRGLNVLETARLFAMADVTGVDNSIACSSNKEVWGFWRPVTAIQLADTDGNPRTAADPNWTPLLVTPPFPEYPSGHACATAARTAVYQFFFGRDDIAFSATSEQTGTTRHFSSFSNALDELLSARVWAGVHYRFASDDGADLGQSITDYVTRHYFRLTR
jgi:hypothetical protein